MYTLLFREKEKKFFFLTRVPHSQQQWIMAQLPFSNTPFFVIPTKKSFRGYFGKKKKKIPNVCGKYLIFFFILLLFTCFFAVVCWKGCGLSVGLFVCVSMWIFLYFYIYWLIRLWWEYYIPNACVYFLKKNTWIRGERDINYYQTKKKNKIRDRVLLIFFAAAAFVFIVDLSRNQKKNQ